MFTQSNMQQPSLYKNLGEDMVKNAPSALGSKPSISKQDAKRYFKQAVTFTLVVGSLITFGANMG